MKRLAFQYRFRTALYAVSLSASMAGFAAAAEVSTMTLGPAWAANSINAVVFRNDPLTTVGDQQFAAYYDATGHVVIAQRTIGQSDWKTTVTSLTGNVKDAHNSISLVADGAGYLHISWDHHGHPLRYARSKSPGVADFGDKQTMTGVKENNVTYPQFYRLPDGDLLFFYRDGASGRGNLALNRYDAKAQRWTQMFDNLISGEGQRNAYWQCDVDRKGTVHVSWVWRETGDVASNHDLCYARSTDGGKTWTKSTGEAYALPITAATAEVAAPVPQKSELMNQTSMCADDQGRPIIATYFRPEGSKVPQYFALYHDGTAWRRSQVSQRTTPFSLSGGGTKKVPISRPQVVAVERGGKTTAAIVFRDSAERGGRVSIAECADLSAATPAWSIRDLTTESVDQWEPSFDRVRWARDGVLDLFVQRVGQGDGETLEKVEPTPAQVVEWKP